MNRFGRAMLSMAIAGALVPASLVAEEVSSPACSPAGTPCVAQARLDFTVNIDRFIFFRVGAGAWPTLSNSINTAAFTLAPTIPGGGATPSNGNNVASNWNATAPVFSVAASGNVVPIEVRSNAGQVSLRATVASALSSGANTIPMNQISVTSSDGNLPAPSIPASGTGAAVNVVGSSFGNLVTVRGANWTFAYTDATNRPAGVYTGQLTFTASAP